MTWNFQMLQEDWPARVKPVPGTDFDIGSVARWYLHQANGVVVRQAVESIPALPQPSGSGPGSGSGGHEHPGTLAPGRAPSSARDALAVAHRHIPAVVGTDPGLPRQDCDVMAPAFEHAESARAHTLTQGIRRLASRRGQPWLNKLAILLSRR